MASPTAPVLEQRLHLLEMSSVFWQLGTGPLRSLTRRMSDLAISAGQTLLLKPDAHDAVIFLAAGSCDRTIADKSGKILLTRTQLPGDQVILPPATARERFKITIRAEVDSAFISLDREAIEQSLGAAAQPVTKALDQLWEQEVEAFGAQPAPAGRPAGQVVAFCSVKGGAGATTLAVNTSAALAADRPAEVVLLDLSVPYGHAVLYADLIATGSVVTASYASGDGFGSALRGAVLHHRSGLSVLPGALRPEEADLLTGELVSRTLTELGSVYRVVVTDVGTSLSEGALMVIERARRLVLVVPPEVAALTDARRALGVFIDLMGVPEQRIDLVLNQRVPHPPLDRASVESVLGREVNLSIGYDGSKPEAATLAGGLVLQRDPESAMSRGAVELARQLAVKIGLEV